MRYRYDVRDELLGICRAYYRARYYDANTGRFLSEDPLNFGGGDVNFYGYVGNDPTSFYDPFGLRVCVFTPSGTVCFESPRWNWMEPQRPEPPPVPPGLSPDPLPPPAPPPCSCDNWLQREQDEIDRRSWEKVKVALGYSAAIQGGEHLAGHFGMHVLARFAPWMEGTHLVLLEHELWEIQAEVSAKYAHCH